MIGKLDGCATRVGGVSPDGGDVGYSTCIVDR